MTLDTTRGLDAAAVGRIEAALQDSRSPATRRAYAGAWGRFERWAAARGLPSLPADAAHVAAFLAARAAAGAKPPTVRQDAAAISSCPPETWPETGFAGWPAMLEASGNSEE